MREIVICKNVLREATEHTEKVVVGKDQFQDIITRNVIMCAFDLENFCRPDCAACHIENGERTDLLDKAVCNRNGREDVFSIGFVV